MTATLDATAAAERPTLIKVGTDDVFAIFTEPTTDPNGLAVVHLAGKGPSIATVSRGRMSVLLARRLAGLGFQSLRTEYRGTGDSTGAEHEWSITDLALDEAEAAFGWLAERGCSRTIFVGTCGGARIGLEVARHHESVAGVVLLLPPLRDSEPWRRYDTLPTRHLLRRLLQRRHLNALRHKGRRRMYLARARSDLLTALPRKLRGRRGGEQVGGGGRYRWIGPGALDGLRELVERGVPILMFFGTEDNDYNDWLEAVKGPAGRLLEQAGDLIRVELVEGRYYDNPSPVLADRIVKAIIEHCTRSGSNGRVP